MAADGETSDVDLSDDDVEYLDPKQCRQRLLLLLDDRTRRLRFEERLLLKVKTMSDSLAEKRDNVESLYRALETERAKVENETLARQAEKAKRFGEMDRNIRSYLTEVIFKSSAEPASSSGGGGGQIVSSGGDPPLRTLLVSYFKPGSSERCDLRYRIDDESTVRQMRADACRYWQLSESQFVLRMSNGSKLQEDMRMLNVFKDGEIAQLFLLPRVQTNTVVSEAEKKAILPKSGKFRRTGNTLGDREMMAGIGVTPEQELRKCGGASLLVRTKEQKPSEYLTRIRFRDIVVYLVLTLAWWWLVLSGQRWPGQAYPLVDDIGRVLGHEDFMRINSTREALVWWQRSYQKYLTPPFTTFNIAYGFLRLRQQKVTWETCPAPVLLLDTVGLLNGRKCTDDGATETGALSPVLEAYWNLQDSHSRSKGGNYGRGITKPYLHQSDGRLGSLTGSSGKTYDGSGYAVDYDLMFDASQVATSIEQDIVALHNAEWLDARTRLVTWSLTVYNPHYDLFLSLDYILETPLGGQPMPRIQALPFRPNTRETVVENSEALTFHIRLLCALYILCSVITMEVAARERVYKAGGKYLFTLLGIADQLIVVTAIFSYFFQLVAFGQESTLDVMRPGKTEFRHYATYGESYWAAFQVDGVMIAYLMLRLSRYFTILRRVWFLWQTLGRLTFKLAYFIALSVVLVAFWTKLGHTIFGQVYGDSHWVDLRASFLSVMRLLRGDGNFLWLPTFDPAIATSRAPTFYIWASVYGVCYYLTMVLVIQKIFTAIIVEQFLLVKLCWDPRPQTPWDPRRTLQWATPPLLFESAGNLLAKAQAYSAKKAA
ncbi:unnamed protein product [Amoebophrya sp. A25]|nr:unnamed protein product [Amoebophrya sp. A25]|eukprot:GSA25T00023550001.1